MSQNQPVCVPMTPQTGFGCEMGCKKLPKFENSR